MKTIYNPKEIELRWQKWWAENKVYQPDLKAAKKPFYNLMMFPYPSAEGLHVGNMYAFTGADVYGRFQRMQGYDVFEPIGLDGFGIHSENYAIKVGRHPAEHAKASEKHFYQQLHMIGNGFAWDQKLETYDPDYYRWTQWLFVQMYKHGLAYRKKAMVNWCPSCKTVLSDEQVEGGVCERCKTPTTRKETEQWFLRITKYANRLLENLEKIDWPKKITVAQKNWIGRKEGVVIHHKVNGLEIILDAFSAYPAWLFADTFLVIAPDHPVIEKLQLEAKYYQECNSFLEETKKISIEARRADKFEKKGVFTGRYARDPFTGEDMPIWLANFALLEIGTGIVRCSAHDPRDYEFARKYNISLREIVERSQEEPDKPIHAHINKGTLKKSGEFTGRNIEDILEEIVEWIVKKKIGERVTTYHLRDWLISRQRYWGPPIPMIFCQSCGWQPVPENQLPVLLPYVKDFQPLGEGKTPLQKAPKEWREVKCPNCGKIAERSTEVSDTFLDSSWYFLAYPNLDYIHRGRGQDNREVSALNPFNLGLTKKWLPVDAYIGGAEHAVLHLLYSRFVWMALSDWGFLPSSNKQPATSNKSVSWDEPFPFLFSHGLIIKDGTKMSKSRGNVVTPDEYIVRYGADALRMYLMFLGPYSQGGDFRDTGMAGMYRFLERVWKKFQNSDFRVQSSEKEVKRVLNKTIKKVTEDVTKFKYNTAISALMEFMNAWEGKNGERRTENSEQSKSGRSFSKEDASSLIKLFSPFIPHLVEELWVGMGNEPSVHAAQWPKFDDKLAAAETARIPVQVNGKTRVIIEIEMEKSKNQNLLEQIARKNPSVVRHLAGKKEKQVIFVPGKILNFVVE